MNNPSIIMKKSEQEMKESFIQVSFQKDLNMINTFIFTSFCASLVNAVSTLLTTTNKTNLLISAGLFCFMVIIFIVKVFYLSFSEIAKESQAIDFLNGTHDKPSIFHKMIAI